LGRTLESEGFGGSEPPGKFGIFSAIMYLRQITVGQSSCQIILAGRLAIALARKRQQH
jgi:hypothetical protein